MFTVRKIFVSGLISLVALPVCANTLLHGDATVSITSDTAVNAKNIAFDEARRQVLTDSLRQYSDAASVRDILKNTSSSDLAGMVSSVSIGDEMTSNTTYSAKITVIFDERAVRTWLTENNVQHWLPDTERPDLFSAVVELSNKVPQWIELNDIARTENLKLHPQKITGAVINLVLPTDRRSSFTIALRENGWKYSDKDGVLHIWK